MNDIHRLTGAYAVDALDETERAEFEAHLEVCPECRAEVEGLREAAALLAEDRPVTPPPSLREAVLRDVSTVRPLPPAVPDDEAGTPSRGRRGPARRWLPMLVAAAVVAVLGLGGVVVQQLTGGETSPQQLTATEQVLQADDATRHQLQVTTDGNAWVVRSESLGRAVLVTEGWTAPPQGKVYELWLQRPDGTMTPAGLMSRGSSRTVLFEGDATRAVGAGVTIEPAGGSEQPTSAPIAIGAFDQSA